MKGPDGTSYFLKVSFFHRFIWEMRLRVLTTSKAIVVRFEDLSALWTIRHAMSRCIDSFKVSPKYWCPRAKCCVLCVVVHPPRFVDLLCVGILSHHFFFTHTSHLTLTPHTKTTLCVFTWGLPILPSTKDVIVMRMFYWKFCRISNKFSSNFINAKTCCNSGWRQSRLSSLLSLACKHDTNSQKKKLSLTEGKVTTHVTY